MAGSAAIELAIELDIPMTSRDVFALQNSDLNRFLFAEVGTETNGMTLTVVSAIARLGEDPWEEARRLATLPKVAATSHLARIIAKMPKSPWGGDEAATIAARLIPLLPANPGGSAPSQSPPAPRLVFPPWTKKALFYSSMVVLLAFAAIMQQWSDKGDIAPPTRSESQTAAPTTPSGAAADRVHAGDAAKP